MVRPRQRLGVPIIVFQRRCGAHLKISLQCHRMVRKKALTCLISIRQANFTGRRFAVPRNFKRERHLMSGSIRLSNLAVPSQNVCWPAKIMSADVYLKGQIVSWLVS